MEAHVARMPARRCILAARILAMRVCEPHFMHIWGRLGGGDAQQVRQKDHNEQTGDESAHGLIIGVEWLTAVKTRAVR